MKMCLKIAMLAHAVLCSLAQAQTFKVQNLDLLGTSSFASRPMFNGNTPWDSGNFNPASYATLSGPAFSGIPTAPTAALGTNTNQIATTAFVADNAPCPSIMDYGGNNTNSADNSAAFGNAAAAGPSARACVYFPAGKYEFLSQVNYSLSLPGASISIIGAGADVTELTWPNATNGLIISYSSPGNSSHLRDMTISTGQSGAGQAATFISTSSLNQFAQNDIQRVTFRGADNSSGTGGADYWASAYVYEGVSGTSVDTVTIYGAGSGAGLGAVYEGNGTGYSIYHNLSKITFNSIFAGVVYGSYSQGITISQANFQNDSIGVYAPASETGVLSQLQISDSQFANTGTDIALQTNIGNVMIHDNDMFCHVGESCINISSPEGYSIIGNNISTDGSGSATGIAIGTAFAAGQTGTIVGNNFTGLSVGVLLGASSTGNNVQSNAYNGVTTPVDNLHSGSNTVGGGSQ